MGIRVDDETLRKILATPGVVVSPAFTPPGGKPDDGKRKKPELVEPSFTKPATWVIPLEMVSEINQREWRKRSSRTQAARLAVSRALGHQLWAVVPYSSLYHSGCPILVTLTRLGGRRLDAANLPTALKAAEDAVAMMLGASDGSPLWHSEFLQEPGGDVGVKIQLAAKAVTA